MGVNVYQPQLDQLVLTEQELRAARQCVQRMAYFRWLDAGCPKGSELDHWVAAEQEWIEYEYVPDRYIALTSPDWLDSMVRGCG